LPALSCIDIFIVAVLADMRAFSPGIVVAERVGNTAEKLIPLGPGIPAVEEPKPFAPVGELTPQPKREILNAKSVIIADIILIFIF
jgi:hypothetical protein